MKFKLLSVFLLAAVSPAVNAQLLEQELKVGDKIVIDGEEYCVGPNLVKNGNFKEVEDGQIVGWSNGQYGPLTTSAFVVIPEGGRDGGQFIRSNGGSTGANDVKSIGTRWGIEPASKYYFSFWMKGQGAKNQYVPVVSLTSNNSTAAGQNEGTVILGKTAPASGQWFGHSAYNSNGTWAQTSFTFNSETNTYLQFNARWIPNNCSLDDVFLAKLFDSNTSPYDIMCVQLQAKMEEGQSFIETQLSDYPGLESELIDNIEVYESPAETVEAIQVQIDSIQSKMNYALAGKNAAILLAKNLEANQSAIELEYPGVDAFTDVFERLSDLSPDEAVAADYINGVAEFKLALKNYYMSQEATKDNAADFTFLIPNPYFTREGGDHTVKADGSTDGWIKGSTYTGGDQRLGYSTVGVNCWNAWGVNFKGKNVEIHSNLTGLPNGWYSVAADLLTQKGCCYQQRVYARSSVNYGESPYLTAEDVYSNLSSSEQKVLVMDGKMTIGAIGEGRTATSSESTAEKKDGRDGWFCVTNFTLAYYGPATIEEFIPFYTDKVAECKACCDTMRFAADKAAFAAQIEKFSNATELDEMNIALDSLNAALAIAKKSEATYVDMVSRPDCSFAIVKDNLAGLNEDFEGYGAAEDLVKAGVAYYEAESNAKDASYVEQNERLNRFKKYASFDNSGVWTLYNQANDLSETSTDEGKKVMQDAMTTIKNFMMAGQLQPVNEVDSIIARVQSDMNLVKIANSLVGHTGTDYTTCIQNPGAQAETGWTFNRGGGNTNTNVKEAYNGDVTNRYFDSWNATAGVMQYTANQELIVPNGTYELKAKYRASGQGAYIFAIPDADTTKAVASELMLMKHNYTKYNNEELKAADGSDSLAVITNKYGTIWEAVADKVIAGETLTEAEDSIYSANSSMGFGWGYVTLNVTVTDHRLSIGITTDAQHITNILGADAQKFTGTWFSVDDFTLTMLSEGAGNDGWSPLTGVKEQLADVTAPAIRVENGKVVANQPLSIYNVEGKLMPINKVLPAGVYVVKCGNQSVKILLK